MIQEITNFVDELSPEVFEKDRELNEGLYLLIDVDSDGNLLNKDKNGRLNPDDIILHKKGDELDPKRYHLLQWQINSNPVNHYKTFDSVKKIFNKVCSPFAIGFKKSSFEKNIDEEGKKEKYSDIEKSIDLYLRKASEYLESKNEKFEALKTFCDQHIIDFITNLEEYEELNKNDVVYILLNDFEISEQKKFHQRYLSEKVFNKDEYNKKVGGNLFGISDSLSGFNRKKPFLKHQTAPLDLNFRVSGKQAMRLWQFFQLKKNNTIPSPFPLFIDKKELSEKVVSIFNEDRRLGYAEIIKNLIEGHDEEYLSNYYLIFFRGSEIIDLDFVSSFKFYLNQKLKIEEVFPLGKAMEGNIRTIFELEKNVVNKIFNSQLIQTTRKGSKWLKYFDDVDYDPKYFTLNGYNQFLKYRKAFYDYIYKSKKQAVTQGMVEDIIVNGILDDIRQDKMEEGGHTNEYRIKEKLNIWFSLYNFFDSNNQNSIDMIKTTKELKERLLTIADGEDENGQILEVNAANDRLFAFAAGQVIYKILIQSKSSNRSHALLEPFLQKKDPALFKDAIAKAFDRYKHEFTLYPKKYEFDRVMGEVMGYSPEEKNMKNLLPNILAGYFTESIFKK